RSVSGIDLLGCRRLLPDARFRRSPGVCGVAASDFDAGSRFSTPLGPARMDRALDNPNLAICLCHRRARLFDALRGVPAGRELSTMAAKQETDSMPKSCARR